MNKTIHIPVTFAPLDKQSAWAQMIRSGNGVTAAGVRASARFTVRQSGTVRFIGSVRPLLHGGVNAVLRSEAAPHGRFSRWRLFAAHHTPNPFAP